MRKAKEGKMLSKWLCDITREIAEMRYYRLSGYSNAKACNLSDAEIDQIELQGGLKHNWSKDAQKRILARTIDECLRRM